MSAFIDPILSSLCSIVNSSTILSVYDAIISIPILEIVKENVAKISVVLYFLWYIKAYLSVNDF